MTHRLAPLLLPLLLGLSWVPEMGWAGAPAPGASIASSTSPRAAPVPAWLKSELYFGAGLANGSQISPGAWAAFLAEVITPAFPDGLTVVQANGQMKGADGLIRRQPTWVVVILRPVGSAQDQKLGSLIRSFRSRFSGAEVMRVDIPVAPPQFFAN